jgi:8-oxo-dGTP diphosphatase
MIESMVDTSAPRFCMICASALETRKIEGRTRPVCLTCGWVYYQQLKVGAGAIIEKDECLLLLRRAKDPWKGTWNIPSGYVEFDEEPAHAAEREAFEETGLRIRVRHLLDVYFFADDPRGNGLHFIFASEVIASTLRNSHESTGLRYFSPSEIPENLCGAGHERAIRAWQKGKLDAA